MSALTHPAAKEPTSEGPPPGPKALPAERADELAKVEVYGQAMRHELLCNAHKGEWTPSANAIEKLGGEVVYHALKLALAMRRGDRAATLEFAADVGNCALMAADVTGALDVELLCDEPAIYGSAGLRAFADTVLRQLGPGMIPDLPHPASAPEPDDVPF